MPFCSQCGSQIGDEVLFCPNCGAKTGESGGSQAPNPPPYTASQYPPPASQGQPYNANPGGQIDTQPYFIWSLLNTILCCMPLGIAGLIYVNKIKSATSPEEAAKTLANVKTMCLIGTIGGAVGCIFVFFMSMLANI